MKSKHQNFFVVVHNLFNKKKLKNNVFLIVDPPTIVTTFL